MAGSDMRHEWQLKEETIDMGSGFNEDMERQLDLRRSITGGHDRSTEEAEEAKASAQYQLRWHNSISLEFHRNITSFNSCTISSPILR